MHSMQFYDFIRQNDKIFRFGARIMIRRRSKSFIYKYVYEIIQQVYIVLEKLYNV